MTAAEGLPGLAVDVIVTAARVVGAEVSSINLTLYRSRPCLTVHLCDQTEATGRAVLAALGVRDPQVSQPGPKYSYSRLTATVAALDADVEIVVDRIAEVVEPGDVDALVAEVAAARVDARLAGVTS